MSKFWAAIRRLLGKKDDKEKKTAPNRLHPYDTVEIDEDGSGVTVEDREPNDFQKVTNRLHPYDTVEIEEGSGVTVEAQQKRPPRPYDEVGPPDTDGKMDVK